MILVSAGHYEERQGASYEGVTEWLETSPWRDSLVRHLGEDIGVAVPDGDLASKVEFINSSPTSACIEIHLNSAKNNYGQNVGRGSESLFYPGSIHGEELSSVLQFQLARFSRPDRGTKMGYFNQDIPGQVDYENDIEGDEKILYFLRKTHAAACVIEPFFIQQFEEARRQREACCKAMANSLVMLLDRWGV